MPRERQQKKKKKTTREKVNASLFLYEDRRGAVKNMSANNEPVGLQLRNRLTLGRLCFIKITKPKKKRGIFFWSMFKADKDNKMY